MKTIQKILLGMFILLLFASALDYLYPLDHARLYKPQSTIIYGKDHQLLAIKLTQDSYLRIPIQSHQITPEIKKILYAYEDQYFEHHWGINPFALIRALYSNLFYQTHLGASTLSMQVVRMMHHKPRTLTQKLIELMQTLQLEWHYSKEEILRFYLNNTPYGGNIEGFASAAFKYFHQSPDNLSVAQIAYLISIPKNPNRNAPRHNPDPNRSKNRLLHRIYQLHAIDKSTYQQSIKEPLSCKIYPLPNAIPHLSVYLRQEGEILTTIDLSLQKATTKIIHQHAQRLKRFGIFNGAAIIIDNQTMQILAYIGSPSFADKRHGGENDGVDISISAGSTLKPLIYARALEEGLITPLKKLYDLPLFIHGYQPQNYSHTYLGEVTATQALQQSLNTPAVELNRLLQDHDLYALLSQTKIPTLNAPRSYYGSALVLGGWGISLRKISELFAMLANGGVFTPSSYLLKQPHFSKRVLSPEASYLVSSMLTDAPRPNFSTSWEFLKNSPKIAFKTGTSAHGRDLLTIGYTPKYTVGVWFGNFSAQPSHSDHGEEPTGLHGAAGTLFDIFKLLQTKKQTWFYPPKGIVTQKICQDPIILHQCQHHILDQRIQGVPLNTPCSTLRAEVLTYLIQHQRIHSIADLKNHPCYSQWQSYRPKITAPIDQKRYIFNHQLPSTFKKIPLECYSFEPNSTIYWMIDNQAPFSAQSGQKIYRYLPPSQHTIRCIDEGAKSQVISIITEEL